MNYTSMIITSPYKDIDKKYSYKEAIELVRALEPLAAYLRKYDADARTSNDVFESPVKDRGVLR